MFILGAWFHKIRICLDCVGWSHFKELRIKEEHKDSNIAQNHKTTQLVLMTLMWSMSMI